MVCTLSVMELGERIKTARKAAGLTQAALAALCGWDPPSRLGNYEQGIREPSLADLRLIAEHVGPGGFSYAWIVLGEAFVTQSHIGRLTPEKILSAVRIARGAVTSAGMDDFSIDDPGDAALVALALEELLESGIDSASDGDVQRFARKVTKQGEEDDGKRVASGSDGRARSAARKKEAGGEGEPKGRRSRKRAA